MVNNLQTYYTFWISLCGTTLFGCVAGMLGFFIVMRGHSLLTDVVCHATLPGTIVPYFYITSINQYICMLGGLMSGILSIISVYYLEKITRLKLDAILGVVVSFFFGSGLVLVTYIQKKGYAQQGLLNKLFLGNAALFSYDDFKILLCVTFIIFSTLWIYRYQFHGMLFDKTYFQICGFSINFYDSVLMLLLVLLSTIGLPIMGSIVMSASLIAPAVFAKQITRSFFYGTFAAGIYGAVASFLGVCISGYYAHMPTGPVIALLLTMTTFLLCILKNGNLFKNYGNKRCTL
jgi:manganese/zinc/iron transport system permease protein